MCKSMEHSFQHIHWSKHDQNMHFTAVILKFIIIIIFIKQNTDVPMLFVGTPVIHIVLYLLDSMLKNTINILYTVN